MKYIVFYCLALWATTSRQAQAHVKWFVEEGTLAGIAPYSITEPSVLIWIAIALVFLIAGYIINRSVHLSLPVWTEWRHPSRSQIINIALKLYGLWLCINAIQGVALIPHEQLTWLAVIEGCVGALFLLGFWPKISAASNALLWILGALSLGTNMFDLFFMLGITCLAWKPDSIKHFSALRITLGIALTITAFNEKLFAPDLGITFLDVHQWNFMKQFGVDYSDRLFILSAGMMEVVFGLLLVSGWVTRLTILGLAPILILTALILGPFEVLGHLPIFVIAGLLLVYGNPKTRKALDSR